MNNYTPTVMMKIKCFFLSFPLSPLLYPPPPLYPRLKAQGSGQLIDTCTSESQLISTLFSGRLYKESRGKFCHFHSHLMAFRCPQREIPIQRKGRRDGSPGHSRLRQERRNPATPRLTSGSPETPPPRSGCHFRHHSSMIKRAQPIVCLRRRTPRCHS